MTQLDRLEALALPWELNPPRICCEGDSECPWNGGFGGVDDANGDEVIRWSDIIEDEAIQRILAAVNALPDLIRVARAAWDYLDSSTDWDAERLEHALAPLFAEVES